MRARAPQMIVAISAVILLVGSSSWWILRPHPDLSGVDAMIVAGRYDAAEARLRDYLRVYPGDEFARLMFARMAVDRPEPDPALALEQIEGLHPLDVRRAAQIKAIEGDAHFWARRYDAAEPAWLEAIRLDPTIPEVGWKLLNIYAIQGRDDDSGRLALRLFATEPDLHDRVQLLLQLLRHVAHSIEAGSIVHQLEPVVRDNPGDMHSALALGAAMISSGRTEEGLDLLRGAVQSHGDNPDAWAAYLDGLVGTGGEEEVIRALDRMPGDVAKLPRFDSARGWLHERRRELDEAARAYRRALEARPSDAPLAYRLRGVLRQGGQLPDSDALAPRLDAIARFPDRIRDYYDRLDALPDGGLKSSPQVYGEVAAMLRQVGRVPEAEAWERLPRPEGAGSP